MRTWIGISVLVLLQAGCSGDAIPLASTVASFQSLGELEDAISSAMSSADMQDRVDSDSDFIPDVIEFLLGTDPNHRDSDRDGLVDSFELFGESFNRSDPLPDQDRDGFTAADDADDNGDGMNDGFQVDTDGDGVANYLEFYGYTYDFLTGQFRLWDGDPDTPHHFTDPLQPSTDQDAYPDGMEVSGLLLDPTVRAPGNDPLVAAYPNIVVELASYQVTLNATIEITESESLSEERSWTRQTEVSHSYTSEFNWGVGVTAGFEASAEPKVTGEISANIGGSYSNTNTTSTSRGIGKSVASEMSWSTARSSNPTEAAHLKLYLKVHNRGTAPISNMLPTLTLKIGGLNVATFEPANSQVNLLVPDASYPAEPGVFWVVDSVLKAGSAFPLSLTMSELRALERGAPVSVSITQVQGDSMRLTPNGVWESLGDSFEYVARCDAVCANLRIDLGDGEFVHHLVYAGEGPSAPVVTLAEALAKIGVDDVGVLSYIDSAGTPLTRELAGFKYAVDLPTLRANGWALGVDGAPADAPPFEGFAIVDMDLLPDSNIVIRAPRDLDDSSGPEYHFAYLDPLSGEIRVSAADYAGIMSVIVLNEDETIMLDLSEDVLGAGFYSGTADEESGFLPSDELHVVITNLDGVTVEPAPVLGKLFKQPDPENPEFISVQLDLDEVPPFLLVEVKSANDNPLSQFDSDSGFVRVFHPKLPKGFLDLDHVINAFEEPDLWIVDLPDAFDPGTEDVEVVAFASPGVWTKRVVQAFETTKAVVLRQGTFTMKTSFRNSFNDTWKTTRVTLDGAKGSTISQSNTVGPAFIIGFPVIPGPPVDLVLNLDIAFITLNSTAIMHFNAEHILLGVNLPLYNTTTKSQLVAKDGTYDTTSPLAIKSDPGIKVGQVYGLKTTAGNFGKIYIDKIGHTKSFPFPFTVNTVTWTVTIRYVIFE